MNDAIGAAPDSPEPPDRAGEHPGRVEDDLRPSEYDGDGPADAGPPPHSDARRREGVEYKPL